MAKAREFLNKLFAESWAELDDKLIECKEADERAGKVLEQIGVDVASLGERSAELTRMKSEGNEGQVQAETAMNHAKDELRQQQLAHDSRKSELESNLLQQRGRLRMMEDLMRVTSCSSSDSGATVLLSQEGRVCQGGRSANISPEEWQHISTLLNLGSTATGRLQTSLASAPGGYDCEGVAVECAAIADVVSQEWGKVRDEKDTLEALLAQNEDNFRAMQLQVQTQISTLRQEHSAYAAQLGEAVSGLNAATSEARQKDQQRVDALSNHRKFQAQCAARITEILYTDMCAIKKIRAGLLSTSAQSPPGEIVDCEVSDWTPGECSVACDDGCTGEHLEDCGGWRTFSREVTLANSTYGVGCPALERRGRCGQVRCPVDCVMSEWSGYSDCSKECGGGVQDRTRAIITKARFGGTPCNAVQEARPCNTGACDQDCELSTWSEWSGCSQACGGGYQEKVRQVVTPIRGNGQCPAASSHKRVQYQHCNDQGCYGDETCVAVQDVVIAVDSSGSVSSSQFGSLQSLLGLIVGRYQPTYYNQSKARIGLVQFGNGALNANGTVTEAVTVADLTDDFDSINASIQGLSQQSGFTNLAQALAEAQLVLEDGGRDDAESVVLVVTDGRPATLAGQATSKARELRDRGIRLYFVEIADRKGEAFLEMQRWASEPGWAGVEFLPGWSRIARDEEVFAGRVVARFCPQLVSPALVVKQANALGFMLVAQGATCGGPPGDDLLLGRRVAEASACASLAAEAQLTSFYFGRQTLAGLCWATKTVVDSDMWAGFLATDGLVNPTCMVGNGTLTEAPLVENQFYDFYAINPDFEFTSAVDAELTGEDASEVESTAAAEAESGATTATDSATQAPVVSADPD